MRAGKGGNHARRGGQRMKRGPKMREGRRRVRLSRSIPIVSQSTQDIFAAWNTYGLPYGRIIDQLTQHAINQPDFRLKTKKKEKQNEATHTNP